MSKPEKVAVIGLDCAAPELVFDQWRKELPCLASLMEQGTWGKLRSVVPPITVPAWSCMMSGRDPGELGIYGFRNRQDYTYDGLYIANSTAVKIPRAWDILGQAGKQVIVFGVPGTYPPTQVNGCMIGCFLTPSAESAYTYPPELKAELEARFGPYQMDVQNFRSEDKQRILDQIYEMTEQHFHMAKHLVSSRPWDFFMMVEMGTDRIHHAFWKFIDPTHRRFEAGNPFEDSVRKYYKFVDKKIAELLPVLGDDTTVMVVSDHGVKKMEGGICINEWLIREGYLTLAEPVSGPTPIRKTKIDWSKTAAWGEGGYYARIFLNVKGREPAGIIDPSRYEEVRDEIKTKLEALPDDQGRPLGNEIHKPQELYLAVENIPPDLIGIFGKLHWRSVGSVGMGSIYTFENDTGPDDANHAENGIFIMKEPGAAGQGEVEGLHLFDVSATILDRFGLPRPSEMQGKVVG